MCLRRLPRATALVLAALLALAGSGCATLSPGQRAHAEAVAVGARSTALDCDRADACAPPSPLHSLANPPFAENAPRAPRH
jgi:putative cardiolipin synthase